MAAFRQMSGRAGRLGLDEHGEAVLMLPSSARRVKELAVHLVTAPMPPLVSSLHVRHGCLGWSGIDTCIGLDWLGIFTVITA